MVLMVSVMVVDVVVFVEFICGGLGLGKEFYLVIVDFDFWFCSDEKRNFGIIVDFVIVVLFCVFCDFWIWLLF